MIKTFLAIFSGIIVLEFFVAIIKAILDSDDSEIYDYCHGCQCGFCMETPKTEKCERWKKEKEEGALK